MTKATEPRPRAGPAGVLGRSPTSREAVAQHLYQRLSPAMAMLGVVFFLVIVAQRAVPPRTRTSAVLLALTWTIWAVFVFEFVLRMIIAPSTRRFLRKNWWQIVLLAVPFLSFIRVLVGLRMTRSLRILSAAVRGSRSARQKLRSRTLWLAAVTAVIILAAADLLYEYGQIHPYPSALHAAAMAAISGESIAREGNVVAVLDVVLAVYSVVFFASLAGTIGAYFLEQRDSATVAGNRREGE